MIIMVVIASAVLMWAGFFIKWGKSLRIGSAEKYLYYAARQVKERP